MLCMPLKTKNNWITNFLCQTQRTAYELFEMDEWAGEIHFVERAPMNSLQASTPIHSLCIRPTVKRSLSSASTVCSISRCVIVIVIYIQYTHIYSYPKQNFPNKKHRHNTKSIPAVSQPNCGPIQNFCVTQPKAAYVHIQIKRLVQIRFVPSSYPFCVIIINLQSKLNKTKSEKKKREYANIPSCKSIAIWFVYSRIVCASR